jgi:hypothetical protein
VFNEYPTASDHYGVLAEIELNALDKPSSEYWA